MSNKEQQEAAKTYNQFYSSTDWKENYLYSRLYVLSLMRIIKRIFKSQIANIIDIGCGTGIYTYTFSKLGYRILGVDYSDIAIKKARSKYPECVFECQDASSLNVPGKIDMFFVKGFSLFNTTDFDSARQILTSWKGALSEKGMIIIQSRTDFSQKSPSNWYFHTEEEITKMFCTPDFSFRIVFVYNKLQYCFLIPFSGKLILGIVNWVSKRIFIGLLKKPVNYFVFLKRSDLSL